MYEVLVYVYENYWGGPACPDRELLARKLGTAGFAREDIQQALGWLEGLQGAAASIADDQAPAAERSRVDQRFASGMHGTSLRVFHPREIECLGVEGLAYLSFLEGAGALPPELREIVIDRALAVPGALTLQDLKIIVLMVYWRFDVEPDVLVLDELCDDHAHRLAH